jgi:hypothetical protein
MRIKPGQIWACGEVLYLVKKKCWCSDSCQTWVLFMDEETKICAPGYGIIENCVFVGEL